MRIDERIAAGDGPSFSFEFFPPKTDEGERNLERRRWPSSRALRPDVRLGDLRRRRLDGAEAKTIDIVTRIKRDFGLEAMAHFTCVGATVDELRDDARPDARRAASRTCWRCAATRRRARTSGPRPRAACATRASWSS